MTGRELLIGVTGGVAAYKTAEVVSRCVQSGAGVTVVLTRSARKFVGPSTFEALTGRPVYTSLFRPREHFKGEHIGLAERADLYLIAPATANTLAKLAHGLADDLVSTLALSFSGPLLLAPAMNSQMWSKPAVQRNVEQLRADGAVLLEPEEGWLSCRQVGPGRMAEPQEILAAIGRHLPGQ
jgi:phosphopantothenoylcysteine decarboxylase